MMLKRILRCGSLLAFVGVVCFLLLASCKAGGERGKELSLVALEAAPAATVPRAATLDEALADLEALARPPGVDTEVWRRIKDRLRDELISRQSAKGVSIAPLEEGRENVPPPRGDDRNIVEDLDYRKPQSQRAKGMEFHYRNLGDYNQDGIVSVADCTPIAMHYGETYDPEDENEVNSLKAVLDGNSDGAIDEHDVPFIGYNLNATVAYYSFRGSNNPEGPFDEATERFTVSLDYLRNDYPNDATTRRQRLRSQGGSGYRYWRVVPCDGFVGEPPHYGPESNTVDMQINVLWVTRSEPGPLPFEGWLTPNRDENDVPIPVLPLRPGEGTPPEEKPRLGVRKDGPGGDPSDRVVNGTYPDDWNYVLSYTWNLGDAAQYLSNPNSPTPGICVTTQEGEYENCWVRVGNGFSYNTYYFTAVVNNYPWVIGVEPEVADPGEQVTFTALLDPPEAEVDSYLWTFGTALAPWAFDEYENRVLTSEESSPTVYLIDEVGTFYGSVKITVDEWEFSYKFAVIVGVAPSIQFVEFTGHSDETDFNGALEGDRGAAAYLSAIPSAIALPPTEPVFYEWTVGGVAPGQETTTTGELWVSLNNPGVHAGSVRAWNVAGEVTHYFTVTIHEDKIYMVTDPPNAVLQGDNPVRVIVKVRDLGHLWHEQLTTVYYDSTVSVADFNWGTPGGPGPGQVGPSDGIWQALGVPNERIWFMGLGDGPRQALGWMLIDQQPPPANKWAFYRYLRPWEEYQSNISPGNGGDVLNFNVTLTGEAQLDPPTEVRLEFLSIFFNFDLGEEGLNFPATWYCDNSGDPYRYMDDASVLIIPVVP